MNINNLFGVKGKVVLITGGIKRYRRNDGKWIPSKWCKSLY